MSVVRSSMYSAIVAGRAHVRRASARRSSMHGPRPWPPPTRGRGHVRCGEIGERESCVAGRQDPGALRFFAHGILDG